MKSLSCVRLFVTPWTVAYQAPRSMGFSRHEYWIGLPFPIPGDIPNSGIKLLSLASPALAGGFFTTAPPLVLIYELVCSYMFSLLIPQFFLSYSVHCLYHLFILTHSLLSLSDTFHTLSSSLNFMIHHFNNTLN